MEVVTTVPIVTLLLASALAPLVVGRCSFWGRCGYSSDGLGQLEHLCPERSLRSSLVSGLCADISVMGAGVRCMWNWKTSQHTLTVSGVVPELTGGDVEKCKGNGASVWPLFSHPYPSSGICVKGLGMDTSFVIVSQTSVILNTGGTSDLIFLLLLFFAAR